MRKAAMLLVLLGGLAGCQTDDFGTTSTTTTSSAAQATPVPGSDAGPGIEPSMHGTTPGVKW